MSTFRIGQRIKKVRGKEGIGVNGVVAGFEEYVNPNFPMLVRCDRVWKAQSGRLNPPAKLARCVPSHWEPIIPDGHRSGDCSYTELMDRCRAGEGVCA